ncbi:hypothetical protein PG987_009982 [Apiospora arundinis]|uniref:Uncharacterized protein n=1 Tax=Apiospora kogelbergensis TaxID=1337665 RepID=A0AAW0QZS1_9PEZI
MWKRLAIASELLTLIDQQQGRVSGPAGGMQEETLSFFRQLSNRVFSSRELSQPEVLAYLLGFGTDLSSVRHWTWTHLYSLYWACARQWAGLRQALAAHGKEIRLTNSFF